MAISYFELLKPVIEKNIDFIACQRGISTSDVFNQMVAQVQRNHDEWYSNRVPNLNYQEPDCRLAYLAIVAAANAATFQHIITTDTDLLNYVVNIAKSRSAIKVCALGAGPGTELLAMAKFFDILQLGFSVSVDFQLLDKVEEWQDTWYGLRDGVNDYFRNNYGINRSNWPMIPAGNFIACDVTQLDKIGRLGHVWNQDIYVVNFLLSEIFTDNPGLRAFLKQITTYAPTGSKFIFIERNGSMWEDRMVAIAREANLDLSTFVKSSSSRLTGESVKDLGPIYDALRFHPFNPYSPRESWNVVYSVGTKN